MSETERPMPSPEEINAEYDRLTVWHATCLHRRLLESGDKNLEAFALAVEDIIAEMVADAEARAGKLSS